MPKCMLVDSLIPEYGGNLFNIAEIRTRLRVNIADVRDEHGMRYLVQGEDYLFSLAGQTSHLDSMENPQTDLDINCRSQLSILEACRRYNPRSALFLRAPARFMELLTICLSTKSIPSARSM